ncbi:uncharacterized protein LOC125378202 [Haliotis rufescens]|uniref:uncharacterized protein LOC125378202 n=1 Tax=Haliotis rufescens TaxID=6454 RepID=UPI00201E841A|nr:uncharacterized protein LOC125378202 [Haliotis rufescens]
MDKSRAKSSEPSRPDLTVTLDALVADEATFLGRISLQRLKTFLEKKAEEGIDTLDFHANGYITDAVLHVLRDVLCNKTKREKYLSTLKVMDLTGCFNITDTGVGWVGDIVLHASNMTKVLLDGCVRVTDAGLAAVQNAKPSLSISVMSTSVCHFNLAYATQGCPLLKDANHSKERTKLPYGQTVIVPHPKVDVSLSEYLSKKKESSRNGRPLCHVKDWNIKNWKLALTEMEHSNPLFDILLPSNPAQVVIPVDAACDPSDARTHIAATITRVLGKETIKPYYKKQHMEIRRHHKRFMDVHRTTKVNMSEEGVITCLTKVLGVYVSRQPLSRSNPYFQVENLGEDSTNNLQIMIGCTFDRGIMPTHPKHDSGESTLVTFLIAPGDVVGFGVEGEWESEYMPKEGSSNFYCIKNDEMILNVIYKYPPRLGMYPFLNMEGKKGEPQIRLCNFVPRPPKKGKVCFEPCSADYLQFNEEGILSLCYDGGGICTNKLPISQQNNSCTLRILKLGEKSKICLGLGRENYAYYKNLGMTDDTLALQGDSGRVFISGKVVQENTEERVWKEGDEVTITVTGFKNDIIKPGETVTVEFSIGGTKVAEAPLRFSSSYGNRCVFMVGLFGKDDQVQILNFCAPHYTQPPVMNQLTMGRRYLLRLSDDGTLMSTNAR